MKSFLVFFLSLASFVHGEIFEIQHFKEIYSYLVPETLVILDIDDTLLIPVQMMGCDEWFQCRMQSHQSRGLTASDSLEKSLSEWEAVRHLTKMEIVEQGTEDIIHQLQDQGYVVMGLTTQGLALATKTKQQLLENHFDLMRSAPTNGDHYLNINGHGVLFRSGILFTSGSHKGRALFNLFEKLKWIPERLLFINDKLSDLLSIEEVAKERGIEFIGLRYAYSDARKLAFNERIADYQFTHSTFVHILSDEEAKRQLDAEF